MTVYFKFYFACGPKVRMLRRNWLGVENICSIYFSTHSITTSASIANMIAPSMSLFTPRPLPTFLDSFGHLSPVILLPLRHRAALLRYPFTLSVADCITCLAWEWAANLCCPGDVKITSVFFFLDKSCEVLVQCHEL